jgi:hypothetical protein
MKPGLQVAASALTLAVAGLIETVAAAGAVHDITPPLRLTQATGGAGSSGSAPPPPASPSGTSPRGSGASVFDTPEERNHSGASNSASGIQGSARIPNAINRDRQPSNAATQSFADVDQNGDGALDRSEARSVRGLNFERVDTNQNGRIEPREYEADAAARR